MGKTTPVYSQIAFGFRADAIALDGTSFNHPEGGSHPFNTNLDIGTGVTKVRLRIAIQETAGGASNGETFKLQYRPVGLQSWLEVATTDSTFFTNGDPTVQLITSGTYSEGVGIDSGSSATVAFVGNDVCELEFNIPTSFGLGGHYEYRIAYSDGTPLNSYSVTPTLDFDNGAYAVEAFRWRNDDGNETGATWIAANDTMITKPAENADYRLRFAIRNTNSQGDRPYLAILWRYVSDGVWNIPTAGGSVYLGSTDLLDTTQQLTANGSFVTGTWTEASSNYTFRAPVIIPAGGRSEYEWAVQIPGLGYAGDTVEFQIRYAGAGFPNTVAANETGVTIGALIETGAAVHALEGSLSAIGDSTGTAKLKLGMSGSAAAIGDTQGALGAVQPLDGALAALADTAGSAALVRGLSGELEARGGAQGAAARVAGLSGGLGAIADASAALRLAVGLTGALSAAGAVAGSLRRTAGLSGEAASIANLVGDLTIVSSTGIVHELAGALAAVAEMSSDATAVRNLAGIVATIGDATASATRRAGLAGDASTIGDVQGALRRVVGFAAAASAVADMFGDLTIIGATIVHALSGALSSVAGASGNLTVTRALSGSLDSQPDASGRIGLVRYFDGDVSATGGVSGSLGLIKDLSGAMFATGDVAGSAVRIRNVAASLNANAQADGSVSAVRGMTGQLVSYTVAHGTLAAVRALAGTLAGEGEAQGVLTRARSLGGNLAAVCDVQGVLWVGVWSGEILERDALVSLIETGDAYFSGVQTGTAYVVNTVTGNAYVVTIKDGVATIQIVVDGEALL